MSICKGKTHRSNNKKRQRAEEFFLSSTKPFYCSKECVNAHSYARTHARTHSFILLWYTMCVYVCETDAYNDTSINQYSQIIEPEIMLHIIISFSILFLWVYCIMSLCLIFAVDIWFWKHTRHTNFHTFMNLLVKRKRMCAQNLLSVPIVFNRRSSQIIGFCQRKFQKQTYFLVRLTNMMHKCVLSGTSTKNIYNLLTHWFFFVVVCLRSQHVNKITLRCIDTNR